ncbi:MAG TPA: AzlD domain-containing protein [Kiloniellales bacterium]
MSSATWSGAGPWWPVLIILAGAAATYVWRALGVALSGRIDPEGAVFQWVACVAYALLAALVVRMIVLPTGPLAQTPMTDRVGMASLAFAVFMASRRSMLLGVGVGAGGLVLATYARTVWL